MLLQINLNWGTDKSEHQITFLTWGWHRMTKVNEDRDAWHQVIYSTFVETFHCKNKNVKREVSPLVALKEKSGDRQSHWLSHRYSKCQDYMYKLSSQSIQDISWEHEHLWKSWANPTGRNIVLILLEISNNLLVALEEKPGGNIKY